MTYARTQDNSGLFGFNYMWFDLVLPANYVNGAGFTVNIKGRINGDALGQANFNNLGCYLNVQAFQLNGQSATNPPLAFPAGALNQSLLPGTEKLIYLLRWPMDARFSIPYYLTPGAFQFVNAPIPGNNDGVTGDHPTYGNNVGGDTVVDGGVIGQLAGQGYWYDPPALGIEVEYPFQKGSPIPPGAGFTGITKNTRHYSAGQSISVYIFGYCATNKGTVFVQITDINVDVAGQTIGVPLETLYTGFGTQDVLPAGPPPAIIATPQHLLNFTPTTGTPSGNGPSEFYLVGGVYPPTLQYLGRINNRCM